MKLVKNICMEVAAWGAALIVFVLIFINHKAAHRVCGWFVKKFNELS